MMMGIIGAESSSGGISYPPLPSLSAWSFIGAAANLSVDIGSGTAATERAASFNTQIEDTDAIFTPTSTKMIIPSALNGRLCIIYGVAWMTHTSTPNLDFSVHIKKGGTTAFDGACQTAGSVIYGTQSIGTAQTQPHIVATADEYELFSLDELSWTLEADWTYFGIWVVA